VMMIMVRQALYGLSDDQAEFQIQDRLSNNHSRLRTWGWSNPCAGLLSKEA